MHNDNWKYYNHAVVSTSAPHEEADIESMKDKKHFWSKWKKAIFARWTSDFDCGYETQWWYIIKDSPFELENADSKVRKHIRQSLKKLRVEIIDPEEYANALTTVHRDACARYEDYSGTISFDDFKNDNDESVDYWGAFSVETGELAGYMKCRRHSDYVDTVVSKFSPMHQNLRPSDALHYTVIEHYMGENKYKYISSGTRNMNHITNVQEYKIKTFGFRKAYCKLCIEYNPKYRFIVKLLYCFRPIVFKIGKSGILKQISSVLRMEEIARREK